MSERYYCPECGQVAGASGERHVAVIVGSHVEPHFLSSALTAILGEPGAHIREVCPGGLVDRHRDRAP